MASGPEYCAIGSIGCVTMSARAAYSVGEPREPLKPVLRWAGGKHRLVPRLVRLLPKAYDRLVEPMAGSAALFFSLRPRQAILADSNRSLIEFYQVLAKQTAALLEHLLVLRASRRRYYEFRACKPRTKLERAVRFAYLNRLCWNGVYRVNRKGEFNVPIGDRLPEKLWDETHLRKAAASLRRASLLCGDFEHTLQLCTSEDVVYLDPPYPKKNTGGIGFNRYTSVPFALADHERLARVVEVLDSKGTRVIVSMTSSPDYLSLFPKSFHVSHCRSSSLIACNGTARGKAIETILRNFD